jgi:hypothetical protein
MDAMIISKSFVFSKLLRAVYCFVITTAIVVQTSNTIAIHIMRQRSKVYHRRII